MTSMSRWSVFAASLTRNASRSSGGGYMPGRPPCMADRNRLLDAALGTARTVTSPVLGPTEVDPWTPSDWEERRMFSHDWSWGECGDRSVTPESLQSVLWSVVAGKDWLSTVRFDQRSRWFARIDASAGYEAWILSWLPGQRTGLHGHGGSAGAFTLIQGSLSEISPSGADRLSVSVGRPLILTKSTISVAHTVVFGPHHVHDLVNDCAVAAVSVHVYTPALRVMERFEVSKSRGLARTGQEFVGVDW